MVHPHGTPGTEHYDQQYQAEAPEVELPGLEAWLASHQLCDLGQVTSPLYKTGIMGLSHRFVARIKLNHKGNTLSKHLLLLS